MARLISLIRNLSPSPKLIEGIQLRHYIANGSLHVVLIPIKPASNDPRMIWVQTHCAVLQKPHAPRGIEFAFYKCDPTVASARL